MSMSANPAAEKPQSRCGEDARWFAHRLFGLCAKLPAAEPSVRGLARRPAAA